MGNIFLTMQSSRSSKRIEAELVTDTNVESLRKLFEKIFPILSMTEMKGNFYTNFTSSLGFAILAFYDQKLAGAVCCQLEGENRLYVRIIGTLSRYRRKGVAGHLMSRVIQEAGARGLGCV